MKKNLLLLLLTLLPLVASSQPTAISGIYYNLYSSSDVKTARVTSNPDKYSGDINIPSTVTYNDVTYSVTSIDISAFSGCSGLTSITIPNSVTSIGGEAFYSCSGLTSVTIPNSVTSIGGSAFNGCSGLTSVTIPNSVTSIGGSAFNGCSGLTSVTIPNSVTSIGNSAFFGCSGLTSVTIPNSVTSIGRSAFSGCSGLKEVRITDLKAWCEINFENNPLLYAHHLFLNGEEIRDLIIPEGVTEIKDDAFHGASDFTTVSIPNSVTSIGGSAFYGCSGLTSVTIPNSVTSIGVSAFRDCSGLTSVTIPNSVTSIGVSAFRDCSGLTSVTIPNSVTSIGGSAFYGCNGLLNVTLSDNITSIEDNTFNECSGLLSINIPKGVTSIGQYAFWGCESLTSIELPDGLTSMGAYAFSGCKSLTAIDIPQGVTKIEQWVFSNCKALASVKLPETLTSIGDNAFSWCGFTSITIPESVTSIGESAFNGCPFSAINLPSTLKVIKGSTFKSCSNLESITIPATVEYIYQEAFANCRNLKSVKSLAATPPFLYDNSFSNYEIPLSVPEGARDAYLAASPWNKFKEILSGADTKYKLTYKVDGEVYKTYDLLEGTAITPEAEPTKEGYDFSGWSTIPATMPAEDVTITGSFSLLTDEDEITIKDIGKTTWCSKYDLDFTNVAGIKAYTATGYNDVTKTIWLTRVMEVPAGTGILVKGDAGTYKIPHVSVRAYYTNMLVGNLGETISISATDGDKTNYYLSGKDGSFVSVNGNANIGKNKAYLQLPTSVFGGTRSIGINYDDEDGTTSIKNLTPALSEGEGAWYTLQGQRVMNPGKGLYIKNGKKVIVR